MFGRNPEYAIRLGVILSLCPLVLAQTASEQNVPVHLQVDPGTPLRLYITKRLWYRQGEVIQAKLAEPVWAFDRIVIPAGTAVEGNVTELHPVPAMVRAMALLRGDFTPLKRAKVSFTTLRVPGSPPIPLNAQPSFGLASIYVPGHPQKSTKKRKPAAQSTTKSSQFRNFIKQQAQAQANARGYSMLDFVRTPNKREWVEDFLWAKLPYHPQFYRSGTRFDAVLSKPLQFGDAAFSSKSLQQLGTQPAPDTPGALRFLSDVSSGNARVGDPVIGVLSQPLFSPGHELALPEGTRLEGHVTLARPAKMFHRGGQLRFTFDNVAVPAFASAAVAHSEPIQAQLADAEPASGELHIDSEGSAKATESKTRLLRPLIAGLVAAKSADDDTGRRQTAVGGANANYSGRALGGFSGFGLLGTAAARGPRPLGTVFGYYGLAWSVYSTIISRGREVTFDKNSTMAIRFSTEAARTR